MNHQSADDWVFFCFLQQLRNGIPEFLFWQTPEADFRIALQLDGLQLQEDHLANPPGVPHLVFRYAQNLLHAAPIGHDDDEVREILYMLKHLLKS